MRATIRTLHGVEYVRRKNLMGEAAVARRLARIRRDAGDFSGAEDLERLAERLDYITGDKGPRVQPWAEDPYLTAFFGGVTETSNLVTPTVDVYLTLVHKENHFLYIADVDPGPIPDFQVRDLPMREVKASSAPSVNAETARAELVELAVHLAAMWDCVLRLRFPPQELPPGENL